MTNTLTIDAIRAERRHATCGQVSDLISTGELRRSLGLSKTAFAGLLNITRQTVVSYEIGATLPVFSVIKAASECFNITLGFKRDEPKPGVFWVDELTTSAERRADSEQLAEATLKRQRAAVVGCSSVFGGDPLRVASWYTFLTAETATSTTNSNARLVAAVATWAGCHGVPELGEMADAIRIALSAAGTNRD
ncbi:helix-turn-helix transcriptional regulator [Salmonella enterica subsp. enterica]|nr:helix-turn-helix transcriptional regulator [Salmonella enterica subsp. enterica serovar Agbeni]ECL0914680.1 helix-turn-helix transcriptional regulator [Salmonella enterica subsp. enterica serovar Agbeni]EIG0959573.1 helix-turn-helix transcriptional regulator [Salmonella enterica subsp. enterica serovar Tudu]